MRKIAIYGKGGIGKSTVSSSISAALGQNGKRVIQIGCDPKQDSTLRLLKSYQKRTVMEVAHDISTLTQQSIITKGVYDVDCIECGGPKPGLGCAGRGITKMFEIMEDLEVFEKNEYDVGIFDVLGDVVCGGFAAPMRAGMAERIYIVTSEEIMALYAANKILSAINTYSYNGIMFGGLILNLRNNKSNLDHVNRFLKATNTHIAGIIPRSKLIHEAERENMTVIEKYPDSSVSERFAKLGEFVMNDTKEYPQPISLDDLAFNNLFV